MINAPMLTQQQRHSLLQTVQHNGVICYPTEAVWGLGCHPRSASAFARILRLKQRPQEKGVILIAATLVQLTAYAKIPDALQAQVQSAWQDFTTCILPTTADCPDYLCGRHGTIAVRLTQYRVLQEICLAADSALVSTSANLHNQAVVSDIAAAKALFQKNVDYYLDAPLGGAKKPSRMVDFTRQPPVVRRV